MRAQASDERAVVAVAWVPVLKRAEARNFRALEEVEVDFERMTALIGPNGAGKSSILRAIDIVLGASWPSLRSFLVPQDFTAEDISRDLCIAVDLDPPYRHEDKLKKTHDVHRLQLRCLPYKRKTARAEAGDLHVDLSPLDAKGSMPSVAVEFGKDKRPIHRPLMVGTDMREHGAVLFIDQRRSLAHHQPWARGSLLARLLAPVRNELPTVEVEAGKTHADVFKERYEAAVEVRRTPTLQEIEQVIGETTRRTLGFLGSTAASSIEVGFGFADPRNPLNSLRLMYREAGIDIPGETLGLGVQSAIVIGIFEAFRQRGSDIGTVMIEEPEMYLHPQAQRYFYGLLTELAERGDCQVIFSTHSPIFADVTRFEGIRLVRREPGAMTRISAITAEEDVSFLSERRNRQKMLGFTATHSELFFARRVLLVEGPADELAVRHIAHELGHDLDAEDLTVVPCGGKSAMPFMARLCMALQIPFWVLHDEDIYAEPGDAHRAARVRESNARETQLNQDIAKATGNLQRIYVVKPSLEGALGIGRTATDKPRRVAEQLQSKALSELPEPLTEAVDQLIGNAEAAGGPQRRVHAQGS